MLPRMFPLTVVAVGLGLLTPTLPAADSVHWRGPEQTGVFREKLPDTFSLDTPGKDGLIWKQPVGGRSSPLVLGDRVFTINAFDPGELTEGERITCFDAASGKILWHYKVNVYHAEVVTSRLGWTTLTADPKSGRIYAHTTAGALLCLDRDGKLVWQRHLSEEFGRFTGYGGRIVSPVFDSGLVMCAIVNSSWGDGARGSGRFVAFDGANGNLVWWSDPAVAANKGTYQSTPVIAVIGGQRLLIAGGSDGAIHALKVRTGERVFSHLFSSGPINPSPVVSGNLVYGAHGEENVDGGAIGRVVCVDGSQVKDGKPKLVWEYRRANRWGLSHPALADGRLYVPDDGAELFCFNAKTGKLLWRYRYGTVSRGAPLINGDKLYIFDVNAKLVVLKLNGDEEPEEHEVHTFRVPKGVTGFVETHATPVAANGRLYFSTQFETYCIGDAGGASPAGTAKGTPNVETPYNEAAEPKALQLYPAEVNAKPGEALSFQLRFLDANGREVKSPGGSVDWTLPQPPKTPTGAQPPALNASLAAEFAKATVTPLPQAPAQQGVVEAKWGKLTARARIRVVPQIPFATDFEKVPEGAAPSGWVNTQGKYTVVKMPDGNKVLSKVNTDGRIPIARANGYITATNATNYVISSDLMATEKGGKLPDMGVVNCRYTLVMDGKNDAAFGGGRTVRIVSWEARPRVNKVVALPWKPETWYTVKLAVEQTEKTAIVRGKVWEKGQPEPAEWTVEFEDPSPNREGAAALYGYISNIPSDTEPGSNIYYDNVRIVPAAK